MTTTSTPFARLRQTDCRVEDLREILESQPTATPPHADHVEQQVPIYTAAHLHEVIATQAGAAEVEAELAEVLAEGPGILVITGAVEPAMVDRVSSALEEIIAEEKAAGGEVGDHFAKGGVNDRIWNALEKLAVAHPEDFVDYYANDLLALAARAWLGPGYQVTSQVNVVNPGGVGQTVHRDYHLGFTSPEVTERYPRHVHDLSPVLTLQGAIAHCDMPVETGPTLYLPHSQKYSHGYLAYWLEEFQEYFRQHHVQLPLAKGDAVFFNPALFHAAGSNTTSDVRRMANLLQISSAFGRAMEATDRHRIVTAIYPALLSRTAAGVDVEHAVAASAEGYAFPTNLDLDQPVDGMSPPTQADIVRQSLTRGAPPDELAGRLAGYAAARRTS
ncbi:phytanoyl-CoA dioxygenase family protein [Janibacter cremeus]|uniref:Ectoine hydroxylase-related dioxygenase (Phytanoyl-CoA dioxygenase family) n=1 Tax=Janibacter cremeus TaxID=1285192 RepID=A0A852VR43_9MICO|nr:phytanoyl-CoA dioxygenase family protein [Janibacter cremeus]NYF98288.1 ectoine hydroxylase-related dioxygenase (phytanoyl-CoA dioxygenase family) [Janibacter cremeus]